MHPKPVEIRRARILTAGLSQKQSANIIGSSKQAWSQWEIDDGPGNRKMHPALFKYYKLLTVNNDEFQNLLAQLISERKTIRNLPRK